MKKSLSCGLATLVAMASAFVSPALAQMPRANSSSTTTANDAEAAYTRAINGRADAILALLELKDEAAANRVHAIIVAQYRALRAWHDAHDAEVKRLTKATHNSDPDQANEARDELRQVEASLKSVHDQYLNQLSADLTADQIEKVKDKMTYNKVKVTYDAYCEIVPGLTDEEKAQMLMWLKEAREIAMDAGSAEEKSAVFNKYKGKINNYLTARGHNVSQAYKDWGEKQRAKARARSAAPQGDAQAAKP